MLFRSKPNSSVVVSPIRLTFIVGVIGGSGTKESKRTRGSSKCQPASNRNGSGIPEVPGRPTCFYPPRVKAIEPGYLPCQVCLAYGNVYELLNFPGKKILGKIIHNIHVAAEVTRRRRVALPPKSASSRRRLRSRSPLHRRKDYSLTGLGAL